MEHSMNDWIIKFRKYFGDISELVGIDELHRGEITKSEFKHINISNLKDQFEHLIGELIP